MKPKVVTIGKLLKAGMIKKSTKVKVIGVEDLRKANLIKSPSGTPVLVTTKNLAEKGLIKR